MSTDLSNASRNRVRRTDRAVEDEAWIRALLHRSPLGFIATTDEGQPFINSNLFVYDEERHAIYFHTASKGRTRTNVERDERVCFTVAEMGRLLPAEVAQGFSTEYASAVVFGRATIVEDEGEAANALQRLLDKYFPHLEPGRDYRPPVPEELQRTTTYRLTIEAWSGKKKEVGSFPGAFYYGREPVADADGKAQQFPAIPVQAYQRGDVTISTDPARLDLDTVHQFLSEQSYWAQGATRQVVARSLKHALCFGVYHKEAQIGFARVISDFATYAHLSDVFILPEHRGNGLGKWLVQCILSHPQLQGLRLWTLNTKDAHGLYEKFGFRVGKNPEMHMEYRPDHA